NTVCRYCNLTDIPGIPTTRLKELRLQNANLSRTLEYLLFDDWDGINYWERFPQLEVLDLGHNRIEGDLGGDMLPRFPKLKHINLCLNQLSGPIPDSWATVVVSDRGGNVDLRGNK
ncbi:UNVERIFIED_CONTAM: hypothetical protein HDU68_006559, partial [Siphonaria sp. JEL0065]